MFVDKTFIGRAFLTPDLSYGLYINIGSNMRDTQIWPEWLPIFEPSISKKAYRTMISKMKAHMDKKSISAFLKIGAKPFFCGGFLICSSIISRAKDITKNLKNIGDEYNGAKVNLSQKCIPTALMEEVQGWDQYDTPYQWVFDDNKQC